MKMFSLPQIRKSCKGRFFYLALALLSLLNLIACSDEVAERSNEAELLAVCDRQCLIDLMDEYLQALVDGAPETAPITEDFRATENTVTVTLGEGLWQSAGKLGEVQRRYADPVAGQAAFFGLMEVDGSYALASLRLKIENNKASEAEWIIAREGSPLFSLEGSLKYPPRDGLVDGAASSTREKLVHAANAYFQGLQDNSGELVPAIDGCIRNENGTKVTGIRQRRPSQDDEYAGEFDAGDCNDNLERMTQIEEVVERIFPVVDEKAGTVLGRAVFLRPEASTRKRLYLMEFFTLESGKISGIYAVMNYLEDDIENSGWEN